MEQIHREIQEENFDFIAFFLRLISYWYIFIISGIVVFTGAYFYTRYTKVIYEVKTTLLVKEEKSSLL